MACLCCNFWLMERYRSFSVDPFRELERERAMRRTTGPRGGLYQHRCSRSLSLCLSLSLALQPAHYPFSSNCFVALYANVCERGAHLTNCEPVAQIFYSSSLKDRGQRCVGRICRSFNFTLFIISFSKLSSNKTVALKLIFLVSGFWSLLFCLISK